jgi:hypothetical protein
MLLAVTAKVFGHINVIVYFNSVLILLVYLYVTISMMLLTWRGAINYGNPVVLLMIIGFIGTIVFTTHMATSGMVLLVYNGTFQWVLIASLLLLRFSVFRQLTDKL